MASISTLSWTRLGAADGRRRAAPLLALLLAACGDSGSGETGGATESGPTTETSSSTASTSTDGTSTNGTSTSGTASDGTTVSTTVSTTTTSTTTAESTSAGTTGSVGECPGPITTPPIPTGFVKRWPPGGTAPCDNSYPTSLRYHCGALLVGTSCGEVFRTLDQGMSWEPTPTPGTPTKPLGMGITADVSDMVSADKRLFLSYRGGTGVFATDDLGDSWIPFVNGLTGMYGKVVLDMHVVDGTLYTASFGAGVHASGVDVANFIAVNTETTDPNKQSPSSTCPNTPGYLDPVTMLPMTFLHGFALADDGESLYYGNKCGGVYRTPLADLPGSSAWEGSGAGLPFFDAYYQDPFAIVSDGVYVYVGIDDEGAYRTDAKAPAAWTWITQSGLSYDKLDPISWLLAGDTVYMGTSFGGVYATTTHGSPWTNLNQLPGGKIGDGADTIYDLAHDGEVVFVASQSGFYVSTR